MVVSPPNKLSRKQSSRIVKVTTERVETQNSDSSPDSGEDDSKRNAKKANHLPPPELLFAHVNRVDQMKTGLDKAMSEISASASPRRGATFVKQGTFKSQKSVRSKKSSSKSLLKKKKRNTPSELDTSGSNSPGERIGSDTEKKKEKNPTEDTART